MTPRDLLAVSPEFLAKAILHRRENIVQALPPQIAKRQDERQIAANLAKDSRAKRDDLLSKVSSLKKERNEAQASANNIILELKKLSNENSKNKFTKLNQIGNNEENQNNLEVIENIQSEIEEHKGWASDNVDSKDISDGLEKMRRTANKLLETGKKAHIAMMELSKENNRMQSIWLENESHRRRCESRYTKLIRCKKESDSAVEFWSSKLNGGDFSEMLTDSVRVSQGGPSSRSLMKQNSAKQSSRGKK
jgi:hypothetical protein